MYIYNLHTCSCSDRWWLVKLLLALYTYFVLLFQAVVGIVHVHIIMIMTCLVFAVSGCCWHCTYTCTSFCCFRSLLALYTYFVLLFQAVVGIVHILDPEGKGKINFKDFCKGVQQILELQQPLSPSKYLHPLPWVDMLHYQLWFNILEIFNLK